MNIELVTPPSPAAYEEFYPMAQLKSDLRITDFKQEARLCRMRAAAVQQAGQTARCVIIPTQFQAVLDRPRYKGDEFGISGRWIDPDKSIKSVRLLQGPVLAIDSIYDGTELRAASRYRLVRPTGQRGIADIHWLNVDGFREDFYPTTGLFIKYTAGFISTDPDRESMRQAVFEIIAHWNETPGEINDSSPLALPQTAMQILAAFWTSSVNRRY